MIQCNKISFVFARGGGVSFSTTLEISNRLMHQLHPEFQLWISGDFSIPPSIWRHCRCTHPLRTRIYISTTWWLSRWYYKLLAADLRNLHHSYEWCTFSEFPDMEHWQFVHFFVSDEHRWYLSIQGICIGCNQRDGAFIVPRCCNHLSLLPLHILALFSEFQLDDGMWETLPISPMVPHA